MIHCIVLYLDSQTYRSSDSAASHRFYSIHGYTTLRGGDRKPERRRELFELFTEGYALLEQAEAVSGSTGYSTSTQAVKAQATDKLSVAQHRT